MSSKQYILGDLNKDNPCVAPPEMSPELSVYKEIISVLERNKHSTILRVEDVIGPIDLSPIMPPDVKKYAKHAIAKAALYRKLLGLEFSTDALRQIHKHPDIAIKLGFFRDENNEMMVPPKRTYNHYYRTYFTKEDKAWLTQLYLCIVKESSKRGIALDTRPNTKKIHKEQREMKLTTEAIRVLKNIIGPSLCFSINGEKYSEKDFIDMWIYTARRNKFANGSAMSLKAENPERKVMSGDLMFHHMTNKLHSIEQVDEMAEKLFVEIWLRACRKYPLLKRIPLIIAIDMHKQHYYGDPNDDYVVESKFDHGTTHYYMFMTIAVVMPGLRFDLLTLPVHKLDKPVDLLKKGLDKIRNRGIKIKLVLADRAFAHIDEVNLFKSLHLTYLMPIAKNKKIKQYMEKSEACNARIIKGYQMGAKERVAVTDLILVTDEEGVLRPFISNMGLSEPVAHHYYAIYSMRWGIETEYRVFEENFRARTTSKNYLIRYFYFVLGISLYSLLQLVNLLVSLELYRKAPKKPLIAAALFLVILNDIHDYYVDPGGTQSDLSALF